MRIVVCLLSSPMDGLIGKDFDCWWFYCFNRKISMIWSFVVVVVVVVNPKGTKDGVNDLYVVAFVEMIA